ncbi:MAG: glycoside hydrolase family 5 protein [Bacteroidota bacterium]
MKRLTICLLIIPFIFIISACSSESNPVEPNDNDLQGDVFEQNKLLGKGINLGNALEAPNEGDWGVTIQAEYFSVIKNAGFNSVRIPIKWSGHALQNSPYTIQSSFFQRIDWVIQQAFNNDLAVIINIHHYEEIMQNPSAHRERFLALWDQIAEHYKDYSHKLFFEILNEPNSNLTAELWNAYYLLALQRIRITNPKRTILVGLAEWGGPGSISKFVLPTDEKNMILTIHYYNPFEFTHQGAEWVSGSNAWLGTTWSGTLSEKSEVEQDFLSVINWAASKNIPVNLGEFGAYSRADLSSRVNWTSFIAQLCNQNNISFHYWEFCSGFGIYDTTNKKFIESLYRALIPANT